MIFTALLIGAAGAAAVGILSIFWRDLTDWLSNSVKKVINTVRGIVYGTKVLIKKVREGIREIAKTYHKDENQQWHETTVTKEVPESEVPPEIRAKAKVLNKEIDITNELERELELVI